MRRGRFQPSKASASTPTLVAQIDFISFQISRPAF
jgi:hypothetical protein